ncbi:MAG: alpha/beta hydrolase [Acidobacteriota bacterium]
MAASTPEELQRKSRRKRLAKGLLLGAAAVGIPAVYNAWVRRQARRLAPPAWGRPRYYASESGEVAFQRLGEGPPVVLVHSFGPGHDGQQWRRAAELLAERRRVYVPDLLGWGRSDKPSMVYDGELYIQLLVNFLHDVVGGRAAVVASGLPAAYAAQVAVDHPQLVSALGLVCPLGLELHGEEPDVKDVLLHRLMRLPVLGTSALNVYTSRAGIAAHLRNEIYAAPERVDAAAIDRHYRSSHEPGAHATLAAYLAGYLNHSVRDVLGRLKVPCWIGWGRQTKSPAVDRSDQWLKNLPGAELDVFEGCGALPHTEAPLVFSRRLERFLDPVDEAPALDPERAVAEDAKASG